MLPAVLMFLKGFAIPAAVAGIAVFVLQITPGDLPKRFAASVALVGGTLVGYWWPGLGPWLPREATHWLPYAALATLAVGPVSSVKGVSWIERLLMFLLVALVAGWFLVPVRESLEPARWMQILIWATSVAALASLLHPLIKHFPGPFLPAILTVTLLCGAVVIFLGDIASFAQTAAAAAAAMLGITVAAFFLRKADALRSVALTFAVLTSGLMLIGKTETFADVPTASYALVPFAPLALWMGAIGPLSKLTGWRRWLAQGILPLAVLFVAVALAAASSR